MVVEMPLKSSIFQAPANKVFLTPMSPVDLPKGKCPQPIVGALLATQSLSPQFTQWMSLMVYLVMSRFTRNKRIKQAKKKKVNYPVSCKKPYSHRIGSLATKPRILFLVPEKLLWGLRDSPVCSAGASSVFSPGIECPAHTFCISQWCPGNLAAWTPVSPDRTILSNS